MKRVILTMILTSVLSCRSVDGHQDTNVKKIGTPELMDESFVCPLGEESTERILAMLTQYNRLVQNRYPEGGGRYLLNYSGECSGHVSQSGSSTLLKSCVRSHFVEDKTVSYKFSVTKDSHFPSAGFDILAAFALGVEPGSMSNEERTFADCVSSLKLAELNNNTSLELKSIHVEGNDGMDEALNGYYGLGIMKKEGGAGDSARGIYFLAKAPQR